MCYIYIFDYTPIGNKHLYPHPHDPTFTINL